MQTWLATLPSTNFRIAVSVALAVLYVAVVLFCLAVQRPLQPEALYALGVFLLTMMGLDVAQFASKRFSDADYAAAKGGGTPSTGERGAA